MVYICDAVCEIGSSHTSSLLNDKIMIYMCDVICEIGGTHTSSLLNDKINSIYEPCMNPSYEVINEPCMSLLQY